MAKLFELNAWPIGATHLYEQYAAALLGSLRKGFYGLDPALIYDAVIDAILDIGRRLEDLHEPDDLRGLLYVAAYRRLLAILRSDRARLQRERETGKRIVAERESTDRDIERARLNREMLEKVVLEVATNDEERVALENWGASWKVLSEKLGCQNLSEIEQKAHIKTIRDRLAKRLSRFFDETDGAHDS
jgi:hypothetical protein